MATSKGYLTRPSYRYLPNDKNRDSPPMASDSIFEFDESEIYNNYNNSTRNNSPEYCKPMRIGRKSSSSSKLSDPGAPSSLPVNIPDWSKILGNEYRENRRRNSIDDGGDGDSDDGGGGRMPPHEFLARTRMASFSVHEGAGRTLKGRDLSRVRNAIWAKTGFED